MNGLYIILLYIHILAGIAWVGALLFVRFVLLPTLNALAPTVRGPLMVELGPRLAQFGLRAAELTLVAGVVNYVALAQVPHGTQWNLSMLVGFVGAVAIYGLGRAITVPVTMRIVETIKSVAAGQAQPDAPAYLQALAEQQARVLNLQLVIALVVVLTMATARFSP